MAAILVVDDVSADLHAMEEGSLSAIAAVGGHVETANGVEEAIEHLDKEYYDIVVTDLQLTPDRNYEGWDILRYARVRHAGTKVIVITGYPEPESDTKSVERGAYKYMNKTRSDLLGQIRQVVLEALGIS